MKETNIVNSPIASEEFENKKSQAYNYIKNALTSHVFPSGTVLSERKLSEMYDMSRTPIRDALNQLTHEGLLKFVPGQGATVPEYTIEDILEVYDLMEIMQIYAIQRCIQNYDRIPVQKISDIFHSMEASLQSDDINDFVRWDHDFHQFFIVNSGNQRLMEQFEPLDAQSSRFKATATEERTQASRSSREHKAVLDAFLSRDPDAAAAAMKNHYQNIRQYHIDKLLFRIKF
ncbi:GntR family transcriptional regulator [Parasporobacterium paucivorans]|uniref:DNA-binding transcriptional regulator, GntR family n=1 Tax=Parasporobacterium paucivorans DSM 15970 TaxID=1122934 RepID=A0A1M6E6M4_9FIRM|nr:GntR family transcriptional regulator [Parasporobacterium paucivorans]SHI80928.1 DNA-binding transcriptional regulator, GntR family [Parasporobacterium paucivorans DSM 15970]